MTASKFYGGYIWTNHALERLKQRGMDQKMAWMAIRYPDKTIPGKQKGTIEYQKWMMKSLITVIATQNDQKEWVVLSCWVDPPLPGSIDIKKQQDYRNYKKASFWGKIWLTVKKQLGF